MLNGCCQALSANATVVLDLVPQVVRYPWYAASLAGGAPGWLTWARYTAFLPLYPVGVASEMWLLAGGLPAARGRRLHSVALPNKWNFAFDYSWFLMVRSFSVFPVSFLSLTLDHQVMFALPAEDVCTKRANSHTDVGAGCSVSSSCVVSICDGTQLYVVHGQGACMMRSPCFSCHMQGLLVVYPFAWWSMYSYMLKQRRKKLKTE
jgi:Protein tyrosine phosphatase-like protein, PTPLA